MSNFYEHIASAAKRFPRRTAVEWIGAEGSETTTYGALVEESVRVATWLTERAGITPGDRIAILAANDVRWISAFMGSLRCGAVVVPLDTAYTPPQVRAVVDDSGARVLLADTRSLDTARAAALSGASAPKVVLLSDATAEAADQAGLSPAPGPDPAAVAAADTAVILYTSGTTADPKGVVLTHGNLDAERAAVLAVVSATEDDVVLGVLPLFHALAQMANLWLPLTIGARVVFLETVSSTTLLAALETRGITIFACVPQFFYLIHQRVAGEISQRGRLARVVFRAMLGINLALRDRLGWNPGRRVFARVHHALGPSMRLLITGGSRFDPAIARDLYGLGVSLYNGYGLTETSGAATIVRAGDRFNTSVGQALPGVEVRIDETPARGVGLKAGGSTRDPADPTDDGEILIRGPIVMREYFRRPDATAEAIQDGWLRTGDLGRIDAEGRLYITGRKKEVIVLSSGKNLYPEEIEAHYRQSLFVKELCVIGMSRPDEPAAERLHAVVVPNEQTIRERGIVNLRELIRFELEGLSVQLPAHKRILSYDISLEALSRTTTGKLRRGEIERMARARTTVATSERPVTEAERLWLAERNHAEVVDAIAAHLHRDRVQPDANLELDLGLDSMERIELLAMLEARQATRVAAEVRATIFTVRQLVEAVETAPVADIAQRAGIGAALPWADVLAVPPDPDLVRNLSRSKFIRAFVIWLILRLALAIATIPLGVRIVGRSRLPATTPFIVSPNHQTFFDGFLVAAALPFRAFRHIFFVGAAEFFETRLMAWGASAINIVPVDPDANLVSAMQAAATGLRLGKVLMLFPEGERTIDGSLKPFRKGAAILASHLDVPIVPVALDGVYPIWPRGRGFDWRRVITGRARNVSLQFGEPVRIPQGEYAAGTAMLQARVAELIAQHRAVLER